MSDNYIGEIRMTGFYFAPVGWALCNGQLLSIADYSALFTLLGTTYGGDGQNTFALPDLRGRAPLHRSISGTPISLGQMGGVETVTLDASQMPPHVHPIMTANDTVHYADPAGKVLGAIEQGGSNAYHAPDNSATLSAASLTSAGGGQPHNNMQPYLVTNFIIALEGIFPSPN